MINIGLWPYEKKLAYAPEKYEGPLPHVLQVEPLSQLFNAYTARNKSGKGLKIVHFITLNDPYVVLDLHIFRCMCATRTI